MSVRTNLGKITSIIQEGRRAFDAADFGPDVPPSITGSDSPTADFGKDLQNPYIFVAGIDKWGSTILRVTK